uniref:C3H1-type domain-containing protein n=1 Tax=Parastrongyloides trichosuri TaxID=131310 RepID=A0A0N4Z718_PARTI
MPINIANENRLYQWMIKTLEKTTDANPNTLSKYVVAMLSKTDSLELLEKVLPNKIRVFLQDESNTFSKQLCDTIRTGDYMKCGDDSSEDSIETALLINKNDNQPMVESKNVNDKNKKLSPVPQRKESSPDLRSVNRRSRSKSYSRSRSRSRTPPSHHRHDNNRGRRYSPNNGRRQQYDDRYKSRRYESPSSSRHSHGRKRARSASRSRSNSSSPVDRHSDRRKDKRHDDGSTKAICTNFSKYGTCKYGSRCNFIHIGKEQQQKGAAPIVFNNDFSKPPPGMIPQMPPIQGMTLGQFQPTSVFNSIPPMIQQYHPPMVSTEPVLNPGPFPSNLMMNNRSTFNNVQLRNIKTVTDPTAAVPIPSTNTLELRKCPSELNTISKLDEYFSTFGKIINIQVNFEGDPEAALITFSEHSEAVKAFSSEKAIFDNRFIKLFWYRPEKKNGINNKETFNKTISKTIVKKQPVIYPSQEAWLKKREAMKKMMYAQKNHEITLRRTAEECLNVYEKKVSLSNKLKNEIDALALKLKNAKTSEARKGFEKCFTTMSNVYLKQTKELKELSEQMKSINEQLKAFEKPSYKNKMIKRPFDNSTNDEVSNSESNDDKKGKCTEYGVEIVDVANELKDDLQLFMESYGTLKDIVIDDGDTDNLSTFLFVYNNKDDAKKVFDNLSSFDKAQLQGKLLFEDSPSPTPSEVNENETVSSTNETSSPTENVPLEA